MSPLVALSDLPEKWQRPVREGALSLEEASELWVMLESAAMTPDPWIDPPEHLQPAVDRLSLWEQECSPTVH